jgi:hypothetical protein
VKPNKLFLFLTITTVFCAGLGIAQEKATGTIGSVKFANSCDPRAAAQSGDQAKAKTYYEKLVLLSQNADDTESPESVEAKAFLSKK